jgi:hypothetical protein
MTPRRALASLLLAALAATAMAPPAAALSCMRPDPARAFAEAESSERTFAVIHGRFSFDARGMPDGLLTERTPDMPQPDPVISEFMGHVLGPEGFTESWRGPVILQPVCGGPWCGQLASPVEALAFVLVSDDGPTLVLDPCGTRVFTDPSRETLALMVSCMQGGACMPADGG